MISVIRYKKEPASVEGWPSTAGRASWEGAGLRTPLLVWVSARQGPMPGAGSLLEMSGGRDKARLPPSAHPCRMLDRLKRDQAAAEKLWGLLGHMQGSRTQH